MAEYSQQTRTLWPTTFALQSSATIRLHTISRPNIPATLSAVCATLIHLQAQQHHIVQTHQQQVHIQHQQSQQHQQPVAQHFQPQLSQHTNHHFIEIQQQPVLHHIQPKQSQQQEEQNHQSVYVQQQPLPQRKRYPLQPSSFTNLSTELENLNLRQNKDVIAFNFGDANIITGTTLAPPTVVVASTSMLEPADNADDNSNDCDNIDLATTIIEGSKESN
uniref:Uncharacterized protein n=1 Tax=Musca domestica TaxID=7370 RepID=A0A1I8NKP3_MUSDO